MAKYCALNNRGRYLPRWDDLLLDELLSLQKANHNKTSRRFLLLFFSSELTLAGHLVQLGWIYALIGRTLCPISQPICCSYAYGHGFLPSPLSSGDMHWA